MKAYTSKAVAAWLDISERRVRQLRDEKVITEIRPGLYDLKTVNHQYINYLRKNNPESESAIDYNAERAKLVRAKREAQELELQLRRNEVHTTEDVEQVMTARVKFKDKGGITSGDLRIIKRPVYVVPAMESGAEGQTAKTTLKYDYNGQMLKEVSHNHEAFVTEWTPGVNDMVLCIMVPDGDGDGFIIGEV